MNTESFRRQHLCHWLAVALTATVLAASLQQGYASVVGYVNVPVRQGLNLIANPLDYDGTGTNNNANAVLGTNSAPEGTSFYRFDPSTQNYMPAATYLTGFGWCPVSLDMNDPALKLNPGEAFWLESPQGNYNITFVGQVLQGTLTNPLPANYSLKADMVPRGGLLQTDHHFPPRTSDRVWKWPGVAFDPYSFDAAGWHPMQPSLAVAEGFILWRDPAQAAQSNWWVQTFVVPSSGSPAPRGISGDPELRSIRLNDGEVILDIASTSSDTYNVQFSSDGFTWTTIASSVKGNKWKTRFPGGTRGYYQLAKP